MRRFRMFEQTESAAARRSLLAKGVAVGCLLVLVRWLALLLPLEYLGWDAYPLLATCGVSSWSDLGSVLGGRLMEGFYPGAFYRPLPCLTVAVELALGGPREEVSAAIQVALLGISAVLLHRLVRRLVPDHPSCAAVAAAVLLLHPATGLVMPYLARRPDLLACVCLLGMLTLEASPSPSPSPSRRRRLAAVALAFAAMLSKEVGLVAPLVVASYAAVFTPGNWRRRAREVGRRVWAYAAATGVYVLLRLAVLDGSGGHGGRGGVGLFPVQLEKLVVGVLSALRGEVPWLTLVLALILFGVGASRRAKERQHPGPVAVFVFALAWLVGLALVLSAAGRFSPWYAFPGVLPFSLVIASGLGTGLDALARLDQTPFRRVTAAAGVLVWLAVAAAALMRSPVLETPVEWRQASAEVEAFLARAEPLLADAAVGETRNLGPFPTAMRPRHNPRTGPRVAILAPYSIAAWATLRRPEIPIRVARQRQLRDAPARPGELTLEVGPSYTVTAGDKRRAEN